MNPELRSQDQPWISVVIATYNSQALLPEVFKSIDRQIPPSAKDYIEVLIVDGGSTDKTLELAAQYGHQVIQNDLGHAISAKWLGFNAARGDLVCFLDHDESLLSETSLYDKYILFNEDPNLDACLTSGYSFSSLDKPSNVYASEFGDPFSLFTYRLPNSLGNRVKSLRKTLKVIFANERYTKFEIGSESKPILCELVACGSVVRKSKSLHVLSSITEGMNALPLLYHLLALASPGHIALLHNDPVVHASAESWLTVFRKVKWRIVNAVSDPIGVGASGFRGRSLEARKSTTSRRSPVLSYLLYLGTLIWPLLDSLILVSRWKRPGMLMHFPLSYYVLFVAIRIKAQRHFGVIKQSRYGQN